MNEGLNPEKVLLIAKTAYEVNRAYCVAIGDTSFSEWKDAPNWQKETNIKGVESLLFNWNLGPEELHDLWCEHKIREGWTYGPVKDADLKQHPCLVSYEDLPLTQRVKDYLFRAVVLSLATIE